MKLSTLFLESVTPNGTFDVEAEIVSSKPETIGDLQRIANKAKVSIDEIIEIQLSMLNGFLGKFGRHNAIPDDQFDFDELTKGVQHEKEHTDSDFIAELIAKDHLSEDPHYYSNMSETS